MPWLKLDDNYADHPKVDALSDAAFRLHTAALCHCAKHLTDGYIDERKISRLSPTYRPALVTELLESHPDRPLWIKVDGGYMVRDFLTYNKTRSWWEEKREKETKRKQEWRDKRAQDEGTDE